MACGACKNKKELTIEDITTPDNSGKKITFKKTLNLFLKLINFSILLVLLTPFILIMFVVLLFKYTVINKDLNIVPILIYIGKKFTKDDDEDDEDDDEEDDEEDNEELYELENPYDIIVLNK